MKNKLTAKPIQHDRITVDVDADEEHLILTFQGSIDMQDPGALLDPLFEHTHHDILHLSLKGAILDFRCLEFMNSSGIKAVAKWIMKQSSLTEKQKYAIRIKQDKKITWQTTSLPTLTFLLPAVVTEE